MTNKNFSDVFIHIGYHKTGTTYLQKHIFPTLNVNQILTPDVSYIAESKEYDPQKFLNIIGLSTSSNAQNRYSKTIISQEVLSGRGDGNPKWDKYLIAKRLKQTFPNAKILIVIRNQFDYILSL